MKMFDIRERKEVGSLLLRRGSTAEVRVFASDFFLLQSML